MIKLLDSDFDIDSGVSYVKIGTESGFFEGYAYLDPRDKENASSFFGCEIAEYRAMIKYYKRKRSIVAQQYLALENLRIDFIHNQINEGSAYDILIKRLKQKEEEKNSLKLIIKNLNKVIKERDINREKMLRKLKKEQD